MYNCDCEPPDLYKEIRRTARAKHECSECNWTILPGSKYVVVKILYDGDWSEYKICINCHTISERLVVETGCCYPLKQMYSELVDSEIITKELNTWRSNADWLKLLNENDAFPYCIAANFDEDWIEESAFS